MSFRVSVIPLSERTDNLPYEAELLVDRNTGDLSIYHNDKIYSKTKDIRSNLMNAKIQSNQINNEIKNIISKIGDTSKIDEITYDNMDEYIENNLLDAMSKIKQDYENNRINNSDMNYESTYNEYYEKIYKENANIGNNDVDKAKSLSEWLKGLLNEVVELNINNNEVMSSTQVSRSIKEYFFNKIEIMERLNYKLEKVSYIDKLLNDLIGNNNSILNKDVINNMEKEFDKTKNNTKSKKFISGKYNKFATKESEDASITLNFLKVAYDENIGGIVTCHVPEKVLKFSSSKFYNGYNQCLLSDDYDGNDGLYKPFSEFYDLSKVPIPISALKNITFNNSSTVFEKEKIMVDKAALDLNNNLRYPFEVYTGSQQTDLNKTNVIPEIYLTPLPNNFSSAEEYQFFISENIVYDETSNKYIFKKLNTNGITSAINNFTIQTSNLFPFGEDDIDLNTIDSETNENAKKFDSNQRERLTNINYKRNDWQYYYYYYNMNDRHILLNKIENITPIKDISYSILEDMIDSIGTKETSFITPSGFSNGSNILTNSDFRYNYYARWNKFEITNQSFNRNNNNYICNQYYTGKSIPFKNENGEFIEMNLEMEEYLYSFIHHIVNIKSLMDVLSESNLQTEKQNLTIKSNSYKFPYLLPLVSPIKYINELDNVAINDKYSLYSSSLNLAVSKKASGEETDATRLENENQYFITPFLNVKWYNEIIRYLSGNHSDDPSYIDGTPNPKYIHSSYDAMNNGTMTWTSITEGTDTYYFERINASIEPESSTLPYSNAYLKSLSFDFDAKFKYSSDEEIEFENQRDLLSTEIDINNFIIGNNDLINY